MLEHSHILRTSQLMAWSKHLKKFECRFFSSPAKSMKVNEQLFNCKNQYKAVVANTSWSLTIAIGVHFRTKLSNYRFGFVLTTIVPGMTWLKNWSWTYPSKWWLLDSTFTHSSKTIPRTHYSNKTLPNIEYSFACYYKASFCSSNLQVSQNCFN